MDGILEAKAAYRQWLQSQTARADWMITMAGQLAEGATRANGKATEATKGVLSGIYAEKAGRDSHRALDGATPKSGYNIEAGRIGEMMQVNEPIVKNPGANGGYRVSARVNTKEFHDAFESSGLPKPVYESLYQASGRILTAADGTPNEFMVAVDCRTGEVVADNTARAAVGERKTSFNADEMRAIEARGNRVVVIHNHPGSKPPSYRDCVTASSNPHVESSVVVGFDGSVWLVRADDTIADALEITYNLLKTQFADDAERMAVDELRKSAKFKSRFEYRRLSNERKA